MSPGQIVSFEPDLNQCTLTVNDTPPSIVIGNNLGGSDPVGTGDEGIVFIAGIGSGLSNVFYNDGGANVAIPSNGDPATAPCATNAACTVNVLFTFNGVDYSFALNTASGSNNIGSSSTPTVVTSGDTTAPTVTSVARQTPTTETTSADTLVFRVTFDEDVQNVDTSDFNASGTTGDATSVSVVSASVYDITISGGDLATLNGVVGLTFDGAQNIEDLAGNALTNTTPGSNQTYTLSNAPEIAVSSSESGAVADGGTDAQGAEPAGTAKTVTYTITNSGTDALTLTGTAAISGTSNITGSPAVSAFGSSTVAAGGGTTSFTVTYTPTLAGSFGFDIAITNDDADENPYNITVSGNATGAPEIAVSSSESGAVADGGTDAQGAEPAGTAKTVTYTITNSGTDALTLTGTAAISGTSNITGSPAVSAFGSSTVAAGGGTTSFTVTYTPTLAGSFGFDIAITNDDADENPYNITVSGNATGAPEIAVSSSESGAVADGGTDAQGAEPAGTAKTVTYTITNSGTDALTLTGTAAISGTSNITGSPAVSAFGSSTVAAGGGTTSFTVTYTPTLAGSFGFDIAITNDDADENPYNITVSGNATGAPEIAVSSSESGAVADGGTDAQGAEPAGTAKTVTYTITNSGTDALTLTGTAAISGTSNITGSPAVSAFGSSTVAAGGGTTSFTVTYTPALAGSFGFDIAITNDDADETPYNITVSGNATGAPEIAVSSSESGAVADGGTDAQGAEPAGTAKTVTYTITNSGTDALTLTGTAAISGTSNITGSPAVSAFGSSTVAAGGGTTSFTVTYTPALAGSFGFDIAITNDDADETPYNITVSGNATGAPEIAVSSSESGAVADGGTDAQGAEPAGTAKTVTYTITNSGTDALTLTGTAAISGTSNITGSPAVSAFGSSTVAAGGGTTSFTVTYTPALAGSFGFDIAITNDDADETPYNITVSGNATGAPEIAVSSSESGAVADGGTDAQGAEPAGTAKTVTYTITNSGTDALTLTGTAAISGTSNITGSPAVSAFGSSTVAAGGGTTSFTVTYTPALAGSFGFDIAITNDDADETPYNITVSGNATGAPEIAVSSSESGAVADGGTDAQGAEPAGTAKTVTYTITNSGTDALTLTGTAAISGTSNITGSPAVSAFGSSTVAAGGGTTSFTVTYTPALAGSFGFDIAITNDDADETPYNITVSGNATGAPEIAVSSSESGAVADGGTDAQGAEPAGTAKTVTYTITNSGTDALTLTGTAAISGTSNITGSPAVSAFGSSTVAAGGGTTSFTVTYTPALAGSFGFDIAITNDDADETPYNITVSGNATGAPEIAVSSSESGAVADGGTDAQGAEPAGTAKTVTYTITNSGTDALTLTGTAAISGTSNITGSPAVSAFGSSTVAAGGGTTSFTVTYTPALAGSFGFDIAITNDDADETPYNITVSGTGSATAANFEATAGSGQSAAISTSFAGQLVATLTSATGVGVPNESVTFTAPAAGASLVFAATGSNTETVLTDANGQATSSIMTANATASAFLGSGSFQSYTVTATAAGVTGVSYTLTNTRASDADIILTQEVIGSFVTNRADRIVSSQPDLVFRLKGGGGASNAFSFKATPTTRTSSFKFSLRAFQKKMRDNAHQHAMRRASQDADAPPAAQTYAPAQIAADDTANLPTPKLGFTETAGTETASHTGFDFWAQGTYAIVKNGNNESEHGLLFAGVDYRFNENTLVGIMGQLDTSDESNLVANTSADGVGWMIGPYAVMRLRDNLYFDVRLSYGESENSVNALGLFTDDFSTSRTLVQAGLTGDFEAGDFTINPFVRATYYREKQDSYVDSLGNTIPSQTFDLGRLEFGPKITFNRPTNGRTQHELYVTFSGIYDFDQLGETVVTNEEFASPGDDLRGRIEVGSMFQVPEKDVSFAVELFYDGIGVSDFEAFGGSISLEIPF
ncbi:choice-of-anchor D domain-containing protein [Tateyamaria sp. SN6-1]|uniref:choice-of-anchor D domain-containing protein n=1 Tax=Tateyamaria sp. SN6-1 TaxID=3092148 RepID=UPI0039F50693